MDFFDSLRKALLAGFGVQDKVKEFVDELVKKGELNESQGAKLVKEWTERADKSTTELSKTFTDAMAKALEKMNMPTRGDIEKLNAEIQALSLKLKNLEEKTGQ